MENTPDIQNGDSTVTEKSIGATLRAARESQGLTVSDVAERIKFSVRQVEALEADDESHLPQGTFLRGFIRSYARYLHLDEAMLLNPIPTQPVAVPLVEAEQVESVAFRTAGTSGRKSAYLFGGAFLIAILLAVFLWSQREATPVERTVIEEVKLPDLQVSSMPVVASSVAVTAIAVEPLTAAVAKENRPVEHSLPLEKVKAAEPAKPVANSALPTVAGKPVAPVKSVEPVAPPAPVVKAKLVEPPKVVVPPVVPPVTVKPVLPVKVLPPAVVAAVPPVKPKVSTPTTAPAVSVPPPVSNISDAELTRLKKRPIHIVFTEGTWMEIKDKNGELLLSRMNDAGSEKWIGGGQRTPYQVTIGKAKAVRLYYRGREVDLSKYSQTGLVHLVLE